tara:strand:+ start:302 stop:418 length:117 start_codon:yes stop_codon:yes gene_type:complete
MKLYATLLVAYLLYNRAMCKTGYPFEEVKENIAFEMNV